MSQKHNNHDKNILLLTRPITPPWDESSKNFAIYLANAIKIPHVNFLLLSTKSSRAKLSSHMKLLPIYNSDYLNFWTKLRFLMYLLSSKPDCVHSLTVFAPFTGIVIKILKSFKNFRAIQTITSLSNYNSAMLNLSIYGDIVITLSQNSARILRASGVDTIVVQPGVPTDRFKPAKKEKIIAFLGELYRLKSYSIVKDLVELINHTFLDYTIVLGFRTKNKSLEEKLLVEKLKKQWGHSKSIKFVDIIEDMPSFLGITKVVIFPAIQVAGKFDYPLVLLESLASGTPIVISKIGPFKELSNLPGVASVSSNSPKDFAKEITKVLRSYTNFSKAARKTAEDKFSIEQIAKKYEKIYKKILY